MPEETGTTGTATPSATAPPGVGSDGGGGTAATTTATQGVSQVISEDGSLRDGWRKYIPEEIREEKDFDKYKTLPDVFRSLHSQGKMIGKRGVIPPHQDSSPEELKHWYETIGRPETPEGYEIKAPVEPEKQAILSMLGIDAGEAATYFHEQGFSKKQADAVWVLAEGICVHLDEHMSESAERDCTDAETTLKAQWGTAYEARLHLANRMITENTAEGEQREAIKDIIGNNPHVADMLANVAHKFMEHGVIQGDIAGSSSAGDIQQQIEKEMSTDAYSGKNCTPKQHKDAVARVNQLFEQKSELGLSLIHI